MKYNEDDNKPEFNEEVMIMSRNIKGGFLTLSGVVGIVGMIIPAMQNPATAWVTPPGRMIVSIFRKWIIDSYGFIPCSFYLWIVYSPNGEKRLSNTGLSN